MWPHVKKNVRFKRIRYNSNNNTLSLVNIYNRFVFCDHSSMQKVLVIIIISHAQEGSTRIIALGSKAQPEGRIR